MTVGPSTPHGIVEQSHSHSIVAAGEQKRGGCADSGRIEPVEYMPYTRQGHLPYEPATIEYVGPTVQML